MKKILSLLLSCFCIGSPRTQAQVTLTVVTVPQYYTPLLDTLFVMGNFNNWNPADPKHCLLRQANGTYQVTLHINKAAPVEYKFTRGSWATVETQADGKPLPNRILPSTPDDHITITDLQIENWKDLATTGKRTATGFTHILDMDFDMPQLQRKRRIWVWLPPDYYTDTTRHYPVLYMHDGQNLFDQTTSYAGEWQIDENMEKLAAEGQPIAIVIGIDNGGQTRMNEYSPWVHPKYGGGEGEEYLKFLVETLKPFVDGYFRTLPDREHTALMGSSMGALISYYGCLKYWQVFSKAGLFSPSFWFSEQTATFAQTIGHQAPMRLYFLCGTEESATMLSDMQNIYHQLLKHGFSEKELSLQPRTDGKHSEWFWAREFHDAYIWLFSSY